MPINQQNEYDSLRAEMLQRFSQIHDTAKFGLGAFVVFVAYYYKTTNFDDIVAQAVFQLFIAVMGLSCLRLYKSIYFEGTYIAVILESGQGAKYHRMSRQFGDYISLLPAKKVACLPFPFGSRWGGDSAQIAMLLITILFIALLSPSIKHNNFMLFSPPSKVHYPLILITLNE